MNMDLQQNSPNHKYNRRSHIQTSHINPYGNYQKGKVHDPTSYDTYEQGDFPNINMINKTRNPHPEDVNKNMQQKNQSYSNMNKKLEGISFSINDLRQELDNVTASNQAILTEIERIELSHSNLISNRICLVEEVIERKTNLILLKKEIEVKRGYLNSLMRIKKTQIEETKKSKMNSLIKQIDNINDSTDILNEAASQIKNLHGINLKILDDVNKEILVNLIKNS